MPPEHYDKEILQEALAARDPQMFTAGEGIMGWCLGACARHYGPNRK